MLRAVASGCMRMHAGGDRHLSGGAPRRPLDAAAGTLQMQKGENKQRRILFSPTLTSKAQKLAGQVHGSSSNGSFIYYCLLLCALRKNMA